MKQKSLRDYSEAGRLQQLRDDLVVKLPKEVVDRLMNSIPARCPKCYDPPLNIPDLAARYKLRVCDEYYRKVRIIAICSNCNKIFVRSKTFVDIWHDILTDWGIAATLKEAARETPPVDYRCPKCFKHLNLSQYSLGDIYRGELGAAIQCYHCHQLISVPKEKLGGINE